MSTEETTGASSFRSMPDMWHHRVGSTPDSEAILFRKGDRWASHTWQEAGDIVRDIASALLAFGLRPEERCAILSVTRPEWIYTDMGTMCAGGAVTTIYPSNTPEECRYILADCDARLVFAEDDDQVAKLARVREEIPLVERVVVIDGQAGHDGWVVTLADFMAAGRQWGEEHPGAYEEASREIGPDHLATLIYTSGTTGEPKGVMLTHDCWVYEGEAVDAMGIISPADRQFLFLPLSHSFAKAMVPVFIRLGVPTVVDGNIDTLVANLAETAPTYMAAVPRIFEKAYNKIVENARAGGRIRYALFRWAVDVGRQVSALRQQGRKPSGVLALKYTLADRLVFSKVKERFGGRLRFFISGGAPLAKEIAEFFHACDILILEGYGLTESSAATVVNRPDDFVFGSVGLPLPGGEARIADDGEILLRCRGVMKGYYQRPDETAEVLVDGWLHTGDIGHKLESGHLVITDRKKEIIVTAGGKNIAPAHFQSRMKVESPHVSQVLVHGDKRPYCVALVTIDEERTGKWAREQGISYTDYADLASRPEVEALVQEAVDRVNRELPSYETVKKIALLPEDLTVENGALTPSLKIKRRVVEDHYRDILDGFYEGSVQGM